MRLPLLLLLALSAGAQQRIVSLSAPATETLYAIGAQRQLVAVNETSVFPAQVMADRQAGRVVVLGHFSEVDRAELRKLKPTLILTGTSFQARLAMSLRAEGHRVLHSEPRRLADALRDMEAIGEATGRGRAAAELTRRMRDDLARLQAATRSLPRVRVYLEMNHEGPWTSGEANPLEDLIAAAGGENIFANDPRGVFRTTHAEVIARQPEVILSPIWREAQVGGLAGIIPLGEIFRRVGYETTPAWRNSRVHYYDSALLKHTGPRQALAARKLAQLLHPTHFAPPPGTIPWELGRLWP